jgi:hypothetical protein
MTSTPVPATPEPAQPVPVDPARLAGAVRIDLEGALAGSHILVDPEAITFGLLEDVQVGDATRVLDGCAACIVGGDLPFGTTRDGLRRLSMRRFEALATGIVASTRVPKGS